MVPGRKGRENRLEEHCSCSKYIATMWFVHLARSRAGEDLISEDVPVRNEEVSILRLVVGRYSCPS